MIGFFFDKVIKSNTTPHQKCATVLCLLLFRRILHEHERTFHKEKKEEKFFQLILNKAVTKKGAKNYDLLCDDVGLVSFLQFEQSQGCFAGTAKPILSLSNLLNFPISIYNNGFTPLAIAFGTAKSSNWTVEGSE